MGFLVNKITGNGTAQTVITNDVTLEAVVNSLVAFNTTGGALSFSLLVNDSVIFTERVAANSTFRIPDKINLGTASTLKVSSATGLDVTISYLQQAIDVAGALSTVQLLAQQASDDADRAAAIVGQLPEGTIDDSSTTINTVWSSKKTTEVIGTKLNSTNPAITGSITEDVYELIGTEINPVNGSIQYKVLTTATTFTETLVSGQSVILRLAGGNTHTVTWPTATWVRGTAPTLTANNVIVLWKEQAILYGSYIGTLVGA